MNSYESLRYCAYFTAAEHSYAHRHVGMTQMNDNDSCISALRADFLGRFQCFDLPFRCNSVVHPMIDKTGAFEREFHEFIRSSETEETKEEGRCDILSIASSCCL